MKESDCRKRQSLFLQMGGDEMQILLVEDDAVIASGLVYALEQEGYSVCHAETVAAALGVLSERAVDLAIIDMQLPDADGFAVSTEALARGARVIFLTVMDDEDRIVRAFDQGAADYVTKPFRLRELLARIRRALPEESSLLSLGQARIDTASGRVSVAGREIALTALEYRLCLIFAQHRGQLLSRAQILDQLWDQGGNFVEDNTLTVYVKRLREKLAGAVTIETVRGRGYRVDQ